MENAGREDLTDEIEGLRKTTGPSAGLRHYGAWRTGGTAWGLAYKAAEQWDRMTVS